MSGPPAHLVAMNDDEIIALFLTAVAGLKIDESGVWSLPAEIEVTTWHARYRAAPSLELSSVYLPLRRGSCCGALIFPRTVCSSLTTPRWCARSTGNGPRCQIWCRPHPLVPLTLGERRNTQSVPHGTLADGWNRDLQSKLTQLTRSRVVPIVSIGPQRMALAVGRGLSTDQ
jgi:hypothetical protein